VQEATPAGGLTVLVVHTFCTQLLPAAATWFEQEATAVGPVLTLRQATVRPGVTDGLQVLTPLQPVSVMRQLIVFPPLGPDGMHALSSIKPLSLVKQEMTRPLADEGLQELAFLNPLSVYTQLTVGPVAGSDATQDAALTNPVSLAFRQVIVTPPTDEPAQVPELTKPVSPVVHVVSVLLFPE
jgi:hypothetical protein